MSDTLPKPTVIGANDADVTDHFDWTSGPGGWTGIARHDTYAYCGSVLTVFTRGDTISFPAPTYRKAPKVRELFAVDPNAVAVEIGLEPAGLEALFGAAMPTQAQAKLLFDRLAKAGYVLATERMEITIGEGDPAKPPPSALYIASRCPCGSDHEVGGSGLYPCEED